MSNTNMKTLDEHNQWQCYLHNTLNKEKAGVLCPVCLDLELEYVNPHIVLTSNPPQMEVYCWSCNYKGYKYV